MPMLSRLKRALSITTRKFSCSRYRNQSLTPSIHTLGGEKMSRLCHIAQSFPLEPLTMVKECGYVPTVLVNAAKVLEENVHVKFLFQTQGSTEHFAHLVNVFSKNRFSISDSINIHDVTEMVKVYLTHQSSNIIPNTVMLQLIEAHQKGSPSDVANVLSDYRRLSPDLVPSVHFVLRLLNKISQHSRLNGMDTRKMATIFVLDILKPLTTTESNDNFDIGRLRRVQKLPYDIMAIEYLIQNIHLFNKDQLVIQPPPLLPPPDKTRKIKEMEEKKESGRVYDVQEKHTNEPKKQPSKELRSKLAIKRPESTDLFKNEASRVPHFGLPKSPSAGERKLVKEEKEALGKNDRESLKLTPSTSAQEKKKLGKKLVQRKRKRSVSQRPGRKVLPSNSLSQVGAPMTPKKCDSAEKTRGRVTSRDRGEANVDQHRFFQDRKHKKASRKSPQRNRLDMGLQSEEEEFKPWGGHVSESDDMSLMLRNISHTQTFEFLDKHQMTLESDGEVSVFESANVVKLKPEDLWKKKQPQRSNQTCTNLSKKKKMTNVQRPVHIPKEIKVRPASKLDFSETQSFDVRHEKKCRRESQLPDKAVGISSTQIFVNGGSLAHQRRPQKFKNKSSSFSRYHRSMKLGNNINTRLNSSNVQRKNNFSWLIIDIFLITIALLCVAYVFYISHSLSSESYVQFVVNIIENITNNSRPLFL